MKNDLKWYERGIGILSGIIFFLYKVGIITMFYNEVVIDQVTLVCLPEAYYKEVFFIMFLLDIVLLKNIYGKFLSNEFLIGYHQTEEDLETKDIRVVYPIVIKLVFYTIILLLVMILSLIF